MSRVSPHFAHQLRSQVEDGSNLLAVSLSKGLCHLVINQLAEKDIDTRTT